MRNPFCNSESEKMKEQLEALLKENSELKKTNEELHSKMEEIEQKVNEMSIPNEEQQQHESEKSDSRQPDEIKKEPEPEEEHRSSDDEASQTREKLLLDKIEHIERILKAEVGNASTLAKELEKRLAERGEKYEKLLQNVQEDRYRKDKAKLINKLIFFVDLQRRMLYDFDTHRPDDEAAFLRHQIESLIEAMDDTLRHEMVDTRPMSQQGDEFNEETMEVVDTVETDKPLFDGKVYRSISACYTWTLPYILKARLDEKGDEVRSFRFVLHPEEVIVYKLKK